MEKIFITKLTEAIESHLSDENFGVSELAQELGMSRVTLHRKVKAVVKKSVSEFIRETRLKKAYSLLTKKTGTVAEIAYAVGFSSPNYFSKCFHEYYDCTPGEVLKGTKTVVSEEFKQKNHQLRKRKSIFLVVSVALLAVTVGLIFFTYTFTKPEKSLTIVIPEFEEPGNQKRNSLLSVFRDGLHEKLGECKNVNIISSAHSENLSKKISDPVELGKKVDADYIIFGKRFVSNEDSTVRLQIINVENGFETWSEFYPEIQHNIYKYLPEITFNITEELNLVLSEEEIERIEKKPSENIAALSYYEAGLALMRAQNFGLQGSHIDAQKSFRKAIQNDPTFSEAYTQLALFYIDFKSTNAYDLNNTKNYLDTAKLMAQQALKFNPKNARAWGVLQKAFAFLHDKDSAQYCLNQVEKYAKKDFEHYLGMIFYYASIEDHFETLNNYFKYLKLKPDYYISTPATLTRARDKLAVLGFTKQAEQITRQVLDELQIPIGKEFSFLATMGLFYDWIGDFDTAQEYLLKAKEISSKNGPTMELMKNAYYRRDFPEALKYLKVLEREKKKKPNPKNRELPGFYQGLIYLKNGDLEASKLGFDKIIERNTKLIELKRMEAIFRYIPQLDLARVYCALNETDKAIEYIKDCGKAQSNFAYIYNILKNIHDFDPIRDTPEFKATFTYIKNKYLQERKKVEKLLKEERML